MSMNAPPNVSPPACTHDGGRWPLGKAIMAAAVAPAPRAPRRANVTPFWMRAARPACSAYCRCTASRSASSSEMPWGAPASPCASKLGPTSASAFGPNGLSNSERNTGTSPRPASGASVATSSDHVSCRLPSGTRKCSAMMRPSFSSGAVRAMSSGSPSGKRTTAGAPTSVCRSSTRTPNRSRTVRRFDRSPGKLSRRPVASCRSASTWLPSALGPRAKTLGRQ